MAAPGFREAYRNNEFVVEIDGFESPGITRVTGLGDGTVESIDQPDAGLPYSHKISSGRITYDDITLERSMDGSPADAAFLAWFKEMFRADGGGLGSSSRRSGSIVHKQHGREVQRFVFEDAWISSSKFSDLEAGGSGLMKQTLVLKVERLYRA